MSAGGAAHRPKLYRVLPFLIRVYPRESAVKFCFPAASVRFCFPITRCPDHARSPDLSFSPCLRGRFCPFRQNEEWV
jgi:hypothetical protein